MSEMTSDQRETFRVAILQVLQANSRGTFGLGPRAIALHLPRLGFHGASPDQIQEQLGYLEMKELVEQDKKTISRENQSWRLASKGLRWLDENGF